MPEVAAKEEEEKRRAEEERARLKELMAVRLRGGAWDSAPMLPPCLSQGVRCCVPRAAAGPTPFSPLPCSTTSVPNRAPRAPHERPAALTATVVPSCHAPPPSCAHPRPAEGQAAKGAAGAD